MVVVESSSKLYSGVPQIEGLKFTSIVLGSKLDAGDDSVFSDILELTQAFEKYNLDIDKVYFDSSYNVTLYMNEVKIILGNAADITDRLYALKRMENKIANLKGTLYLSDYNGVNLLLYLRKKMKNVLIFCLKFYIIFNKCKLVKEANTLVRDYDK